MDDDANQSDQQKQQGSKGGAVNPIHVQKFLSGADYPVGRDQLIEKAMKKGADPEVIQTLEKLPDDQYETPADVSEALGNIE